MDLNRAFEFFGVSGLEARLYVSLLQHGPVNGSELAKIENLTRASVYSALQNLVAKGLARIIPGTPILFTAISSQQVIKRFNQASSLHLQQLKRALASVPTVAPSSHVVNFSQQDDFDEEMRGKLENAKKEIYLSSCRNLEVLQTLWKSFASRKIRLVAFTFANLWPHRPDEMFGEDGHFPQLEIYARPSLPACYISSGRLMVVIDMKYAMAGGRSEDGSFLGIGSANPLFVNIIAEHIHHDIYLAKMEMEQGKDPIDNKVLIASLHEAGI